MLYSRDLLKEREIKENREYTIKCVIFDRTRIRRGIARIQILLSLQIAVCCGES